MTLMGKTSNRSDFGTEGHEENEGPNDFVESDGFTQRRKERGDSIN
jgi:hypothetical protein